MKILMLCEFYDPALQFQENHLTKYLTKHGHEVMVLTSLFESVFDYYSGKVYPKGAPVQMTDNGAVIWRLPYKFNLLNKIRPLRNVTAHLNDFAPDLIYIHDIIPNTSEISRYCRQNKHVKVIMDTHMDYTNSGKNSLSLKILHGVIRKWYLNKIRPQLSKIYPTHPPGARFMHEVYGIKDSEMEILPLGPDGDLIIQVRAEQDRSSARAELGFCDDDIVLVTGGKITPRKRLELLLQAMQAPELSTLKLVVIGQFDASDDEYKNQIMQFADILGDRVKFAGWQDARGGYHHMLLSDIAIFPASQSVMWQQAIGCGLPLIVGDTGGQDPAYLNRNDNMRIVEPDAIKMESYRDILIDLTSHPAVMQAMANGAQKTYSEFLDWNAIVRELTASVFVDTQSPNQGR
jgi:glycosyltransferase involved in cell wall biosynthesis